MTTQELNNEWLKTYKFYDHNNRQLSIYGKYLPFSKTLAIFVLTLNSGGKNYPPEKFNKKNADQYFIDYFSARESDEVSCCKPMRYKLPCTPDKTRLTFIKFCEETFFRKQTLNLMLMSTNLTGRRKYITVDGYFNKTMDRIDNKSLKIKVLSEKTMKKIDEAMFDKDQQENFGFNINEN